MVVQSFSVARPDVVRAVVHTASRPKKPQAVMTSCISRAGLGTSRVNPLAIYEYIFLGLTLASARE